MKKILDNIHDTNGSKIDPLTLTIVKVKRRITIFSDCPIPLNRYENIYPQISRKISEIIY